MCDTLKLMKVSDFAYEADETSVASEDSLSSDESTASVSHWVREEEISVAAGLKSAALAFLEKMQPRMWSAITLAALYAFVVPIMIVFVGCAKLVKVCFGSRDPPVPFNGKVAIVTGGKMTKAFVICRQLKQQGCRVVLVETSKYWMVASRFSKSVDRFVTVPVPEREPRAYYKAIRTLALEEKATLFVPVCSPVASHYDSRVADVLPHSCFSWACSPQITDELDDKVAFCRSAAEMGLSSPITQYMTSKQQVVRFNEAIRASGSDERFIFKSLYYDSMRRLDLFTLPCAPEKLDAYLSGIEEISKEKQWGVQTFLTGTEYSSCGFAKDGKLLAFTDNVATISCFSYKYTNSTAIREWVSTYCEKRNLSGIVCIDFIVNDKGVPYPLECNPRLSSNVTTFYNNPHLGHVIANAETPPGEGTVVPLPTAATSIWMLVEIFYAFAKPGYSLAQRVKRIYDALFVQKDSYFNWDDMLPFLALHLIHVPTLLFRNMRSGNRWAKIDLCIGKMTEENGD